MERLQRFLARSGVASRRHAEELILSGAIQVNGQIVDVLGAKVDPGRDRVTLNGHLVMPPPAWTYLMLNKPTGYLTTMHDPQGRPTVLDLLPPGTPRVYPVGRLDLDTSGLLIMTNDGDLAQSLLHPSRGVWKIYRAKVHGVPGEAGLARLRAGIELDDGPAAPAVVKIVAAKSGYATLEVRIHEGRKRQVRRMLASIGHPVRALERIGFGPIVLGNLPYGHCRSLTSAEVEALRRTVGNRS
ncbi:MAG: pseudouridine synthase [Bacteroidota bacterium]